MDSTKFVNTTAASYGAIPKPKRTILTLYSGTTGGTGKSTLAANLAAYFADEFPVLLVDFGVDATDIASALHGVQLAHGEEGLLRAWLSSINGGPLLRPTVKSSAKAKQVYVMPPGDVSALDLNYVFTRDDIKRLYLLVMEQAKSYNIPLIIVDTPAALNISDFVLAMSNMVLVVVSGYDDPTRVLNGIMKRVGNLLNKRKTFIVINMEETPININSSFKVFHIPHSPEVSVLTRRRNIFIKLMARTNSGRRWQDAIKNLAETIKTEMRSLP